MEIGPLLRRSWGWAGFSIFDVLECSPYPPQTIHNFAGSDLDALGDRSWPTLPTVRAPHPVLRCRARPAMLRQLHRATWFS